MTRYIIEMLFDINDHMMIDKGYTIESYANACMNILYDFSIEGTNDIEIISIQKQEVLLRDSENYTCSICFTDILADYSMMQNHMIEKHPGDWIEARRTLLDSLFMVKI